MSEDYEKEQKELKKEIKDLKQFISKEKETRDNTNQFIELVNKYTNIKELTPELLRNFVEKVYVSHKEVINGKKTQKIRIIWNCIGEFKICDI